MPVPVQDQPRAGAAQEIQQGRRRGDVDEDDHLPAGGLRGQVGQQPGPLPLPVRAGVEVLLVGIEDEVPASPVEAVPGGSEDLLVVPREAVALPLLHDAPDLVLAAVALQLRQTLGRQISEALAVAVVAAEHGQHRHPHVRHRLAEALQLGRRPPVGQVAAHHDHVRRSLADQVAQVTPQDLPRHAVPLRSHVGIGDVGQPEGSGAPRRARGTSSKSTSRRETSQPRVER